MASRSALDAPGGPISGGMPYRHVGGLRVDHVTTVAAGASEVFDDDAPADAPGRACRPGDLLQDGLVLFLRDFRFVGAPATSSGGPALVAQENGR
jgi:hypothetical protein